MATQMEGLKCLLVECVEREFMTLALAQLIWETAAGDEVFFSLMEIEGADRFIGPPFLGELFGERAHGPLNEGLSFGLRCARRDEAEEAFDASVGRGFWTGDAEEATAAAGHVGLSGEDTKDVASGEDVLSDGAKEEGDGVVVEVAEKALLGRWVPCEGLTCFFSEPKARATGVEDVVDEGNPLRGFDPYGGAGPVDGGS